MITVEHTIKVQLTAETWEVTQEHLHDVNC